MPTTLDMLAVRLLAQGGKSFWLPPRSSQQAAEVDWTFYYIYYVSLFFFLLIVTLMVVFVIRYRRRPGQEALPSRHHNLPLELLWTGVPIILVATMFWFGFSGFMDFAYAPQNAYEIRVIGQKWKWQFEYPNGYIDQDLHVPVDRAVSLTLESNDVIHSLFIPALRLKRDAVPGRYTTAWFKADTVGTYPILCAEYCGTAHSDMLARLVVHERGGFERWLEQASNLLATMSPVDAGERLYQLKGCMQCHSLDGTAGIGPTFKDLYGRTVALRSGEIVTADDNYIRQSILDPQGQITAGFEGVMPLVQFSDDEIRAMIAFIRSISAAGAEPAGEGAAGGEAPEPAGSAPGQPATEPGAGAQPAIGRAIGGSGAQLPGTTWIGSADATNLVTDAEGSATPDASRDRG